MYDIIPRNTEQLIIDIKDFLLYNINFVRMQWPLHSMKEEKS